MAKLVKFIVIPITDEDMEHAKEITEHGVIDGKIAGSWNDKYPIFELPVRDIGQEIKVVVQYG